MVVIFRYNLNLTPNALMENKKTGRDWLVLEKIGARAGTLKINKKELSSKIGLKS